MYSFLIHAAPFPFHACYATEFIPMNFSVCLFWLHKRLSSGLVFLQLWNSVGGERLLEVSVQGSGRLYLVSPLASSTTRWTNPVPLTMSCAPVRGCLSIHPSAALPSFQPLWLLQPPFINSLSILSCFLFHPETKTYPVQDTDGWKNFWVKAERELYTYLPCDTVVN